MGRLKIGTHNSLTGEKSYWLSYLGIPFAKTQSKTMYQQYEAGCRLFDLRTKFVFGKWRGAHGLWYTKDGIEQTLNWLNILSTKDDPILISLTYEGRLKNASDFLNKATDWKKKYKKLIWGPVAAKYKNEQGITVDYSEPLIPADKKFEGGPQYFLPLDGKHWQTILPIPWLWKQFYFKHVEFTDKEYRIVDFL